MKIENELKMDAFESNYQKATLNILFTANWINEQLKERTKKEKITIQQYNILRILRGQHPNPSKVNLIKERLLDKMSDVSRLIDRLEKKQLVSRHVSTQDRRAVDILITSSGLDKLKRLDGPMELSSILNKNLSDEECVKLSALLDKIRE